MQSRVDFFTVDKTGLHHVCGIENDDDLAASRRCRLNHLFFFGRKFEIGTVIVVDRAIRTIGLFLLLLIQAQVVAFAARSADHDKRNVGKIMRFFENRRRVMRPVRLAQDKVFLDFIECYAASVFFVVRTVNARIGGIEIFVHLKKSFVVLDARRFQRREQFHFFEFRIGITRTVRHRHPIVGSPAEYVDFGNFFFAER